MLIDDPAWPAHDRLWAHLVSDHSLGELHDMAEAHGIPKRGFDYDHYDVPESMHAQFIAAGAVHVSGRELTRRLFASGLRVPARDRQPWPAKPRLIATDLDHTLLNAAGEVSPRTRAALDAAREAGIVVVPATARQAKGLQAVASQAGFADWALLGNGAVATHLASGEVLFSEEAAPADLAVVARELGSRIDGLLWASVRSAGSVFVAQEGYASVATFRDHMREPASLGGVSLATVLGAPAVKLVVRHPELSPAVLYETLQQLVAEGVVPAGLTSTLSGAPFMEIMAAGVNKGTGVARLAASLGIDQSEVLAFGDGLNDAEMLEWAGRGVAMSNAVPEARAVANEIAASNEDFGVARVIERVLEM